MIEVIEKLRRVLPGLSCPAVITIVIGSVLLSAAPAFAKTFTVNSSIDAVDAQPGDGVCATSGGVCTLRAAIQEANALAGADTIIVPAGTYTLTIAGQGEDQSAAGDLDITSELTISGAGSNSTIIDANHIDRVFQVDPAGVGFKVTIDGVTIRNGATVPVPFVEQSGGGIANSGVLTLTNSTVRLNSTARDGGGIANGGTFNLHPGTLSLINTTVSENGGSLGGGILNGDGSRLTLQGSTVSMNTAHAGGGIQMGIFDAGNPSSTRVTLTNSTVSGNTADGEGGGIFRNRGILALVNATISLNSAANGGGIYSSGFNNGGVTLNSTTVTNNSAGSGGGINVALSGVLTISNTIVAGNTAGTGPDCTGGLTSAAYNLIQNASGCTIGGNLTGNLIGIDPRLGLLADNGGPAMTQALLSGSPAIEAGNPAAPGGGGGACPIVDERGIARPVSARCDIGAYEARGGFSISGLLPSVAGNASAVRALIYGDGFVPGATVKLSRPGQPEITGATATLDATGSILSTSFDVTGQATGAWNVVVTNPDQTFAIFPGGFTIQTPVAPDLWAEVIGPSKIEPGFATTYTILFGNRGNTEAQAVPLVIGVSDNVSLGFATPITPPPAQAGQVPTDWSGVSVTLPTDQTGIVNAPLVLPFVPPGFTGQIRFRVLAPAVVHGLGIDIVRGIFPPDYQSNLDKQRQAQLVDLAQLNVQLTLGTSFPPERVPALQQYLNTQFGNVVQQGITAWGASLGTQYPVYSDLQLEVDLFQFAVAQAGGTGQ